MPHKGPGRGERTGSHKSTRREDITMAYNDAMPKKKKKKKKMKYGGGKSGGAAIGGASA